MEKFAGYGFNKSHAAAYALVAYQTAYFKAHHRGGVHGGEPVARDGRHRQGARASTTTRSRRASRSCRRTSTRRTTASSRSTRKQHPLRPRRHQGHGRGGDRGDRRGARRRAARSATSSISAAASTSASSTAASSRRWSAPARSTRSTRGARRCSRRSASRSTRRSAPQATRRAGVAVRRGDGAAARLALVADARMDRSRAAARTRRPRSASTCRAIRSPRTPPSSRRSCARRSRTSQPRQERVLVAGIVTQLRVQIEPARQDGVRHARRRPGLARRSWSTTRPSMRRARCCARTSS